MPMSKCKNNLNNIKKKIKYKVTLVRVNVAALNKKRLKMSLECDEGVDLNDYQHTNTQMNQHVSTTDRIAGVIDEKNMFYVFL